jgi:hypothetical protein
MRIVLTLIAMCFLSVMANCQNFNCATEPPTKEQKKESIEAAKNFNSRNTGTTCIPLKPHIFREDDGTGGISTEDLAIGLSYLNNHYLEADIEFYYCGSANYINNSDLYEFDGTSPDNDTEAQLVAATTEATDAVNIFFVNNLTTSSGFTACGYAKFPANSISSNRVVMKNSCTLNADNGTYVHEFGHYFNLYHTHQDTEYGPDDSDAENVPRTGSDANCDIAGDLLCDTDADPRYDSANFDFSTCMDTGGETDENGVLYIPPVTNIMSYYPDQCGGNFTSNQYARIVQGLIIRQGHSAYTMDCTPPSVNVPTNVSLAMNGNNNAIIISWTDAAANELGYLIEKSTTSETEGFTAIVGGGTGEDSTSYTDENISSNTSYWYRVKPTNGDCNTYSTVENFTTGFILCAAGSSTCDEFISHVEVGDIDNASNCSSGGYISYYDTDSTEMEVGTSYAITITNGPPTYSGDQCGIWVDWNQDGDFEDMNESISVSGSPGSGPYTATITPPGDALEGPSTLRCRITWNVTPDPCGTDSYGEVEDYKINVVSNCISNPIVTSAANSGAGSLRQALEDMCPGDVATISPALNGIPLDLSGGEIVISKNATLLGQGPANSFLTGMLANRLFNVSTGMEFELEEIALKDGSEVINGGAIFNSGILRMKNVILENNFEGGQTRAISGAGDVVIKTSNVVIKE